MARCPKCRCRWLTLEDEADQHECPRCGFGAPEEQPPTEDGEDEPDESLGEA